MAPTPLRRLVLGVPLAALALAPAACSAETGGSSTTGTASTDRGFPLRAVATKHRGVARVAGLRVSFRHGVPTLRRVRRQLGRPAELVRSDTVCTATWPDGLQLDVVTFGGPRPCGRRPLQAATLTDARWTVRIGDRRYRIGQRRSAIPAGAKRIRRWGGGGYELASMPFAGNGDATTVLAHVGRDDRIDRFYLWIGGAGD